MADPNAVLSQTLRSITETKIRELGKVRTLFEAKKDSLLSKTDGETIPQQDRVAVLLQGFRELLPDQKHDNDVSNIERFLEQAKHDKSFPYALLVDYEKTLKTKLERESRKLALADLYSRLLTEWMNNSGTNSFTNAQFSDEDASDHSFEVVEKQKQHLQELCDKFESVVFHPLQTDPDRIEHALQDLFTGPGGPDCSKDLQSLRDFLKDTGKTLLENKSPFDTTCLLQCIQSTLSESLLNDGKQKTLREFMENDVILKEIADVLNMRYADLTNWEWFAPDDGIHVFPRRDLNGKYRIWMDEDVMQAIFVHYVGTAWCVAMKPALNQFARTWFQWHKTTADEEKAQDRRRYYLYSRVLANAPSSVWEERKEKYLGEFLLSQLPGSFGDVNGEYDASEHFANKSGTSIKQQLLRVAASEIFLQRQLHGKVAIVQTDLQWFATGLSHTTLFSVMRFLGIPEFWVNWFKKFLEAPLNVDQSCEGRTPKGPQIRQRGVPLAHSMEKFLGEMVLFILDMAVFRKAGILLYRLHDDIWLWGDPEKVAQGWKTLKDTAEVLGLEFNLHKTGSCYLCPEEKKLSAVMDALPRGDVSIGLLKLDPETGRWAINQELVSAHVDQLGKQLQNSTSVVAWIHTLNSCIGRFFGRNFAEPAACFGGEHIDEILATYSQIQEKLLDGDNLASHVKNKILSHFGGEEVLHSFLWLPEDVGGLGLKNPMIRPLLLQKSVKASPGMELEEFLAEEKRQYDTAKATFDEIPEKERLLRLYNQCHRKPELQRFLAQDEIHKFMSFAEFTNNREKTSAAYHGLYYTLTTRAGEVVIDATFKNKRGWPRELGMDQETTWLVEQHRKELDEKIGGYRLVPEGFLPLGVITMMRKKKITWGMVL